MSDFTYASFWVFRPPLAGDPDIFTLFQLASDATGGTATDPTNAVTRLNQNDQFDLNETITIDTPSGANTTLMFDGLIEIGGVEYPIFADSFGRYYVFSQDTAPVANSIDVGTIRERDPVTDESVSYAFPVCFAPGTRIATPAGETVVEALSIGDPVLTADGRVVPVKWLGHQRIAADVATTHGLMVRITAGALGGGLPRRDLFVTSDHGMILDGLIVNAGALVNGDTIMTVPVAKKPSEFIVYHIETEAHDVILAEGAASETHIDYVGRSAFDNHDEFIALYGDQHHLSEMSLPRITTARMLPASLRARLGIVPTRTENRAA